MSKPFKMKGFSGFGNSPIKQSPPAPSEPHEGALPGEVETELEDAKRGLGRRGNVVDILRRRKGDKRPPSAEEQKRMTEYSTKHGHRQPTELEKIKSDFTGKSIKEVVTKKKSPAKQSKTKGFGPSTAFGGVKNPELTKTKKPFSTKAMKDGSKTNIHGIDLGKDPHWQPYKKKSPTKQKSTLPKDNKAVQKTKDRWDPTDQKLTNENARKLYKQHEKKMLDKIAKKLRKTKMKYKVSVKKGL